MGALRQSENVPRKTDWIFGHGKRDLDRTGARGRKQQIAARENRGPFGHIEKPGFNSAES